MKKEFLLFLLLGALVITGCGRGGQGKTPDLRDATAEDSMMYYFGEMQAANYWQDAETDTLLRSEKSRDAFVRGFRKALTIDDDNAAYNKGLQLGVRLALRLRELDARFGIDLPEEMLADALEYYLSSDTLVNSARAQQGYYKIKDRYELTAATKETNAAKTNLAKKGKARGFEMVNDTLYARDITPPAKVRKFKEGDRLAIQITASTIDGREIATRQFPDSVTLGEGRIPLVVRHAIYTMTNGQTRQFMTTPRTLFGRRYSVYNLPYDEPVIFTVKVAADGQK